MRRRHVKGVERILREHGIEHVRLRDEPAVKLSCRGADGETDVVIYVDEAKAVMSFICPRLLRLEELPAETYRAVNEVNAKILMGKLICLDEQRTISAVLSVPLRPGGPAADDVMKGLLTLHAVIAHAAPFLRARLVDRTDGPTDNAPRRDRGDDTREIN